MMIQNTKSLGTCVVILLSFCSRLAKPCWLQPEFPNYVFPKCAVTPLFFFFRDFPTVCENYDLLVGRRRLGFVPDAKLGLGRFTAITVVRKKYNNSKKGRLSDQRTAIRVETLAWQSTTTQCRFDLQTCLCPLKVEILRQCWGRQIVHAII